jgi:hypothetical protein
MHPTPDVDAEIKQSIETQLAKKKLAKRDGEADIYIDYQAAISKTITWQTYEDWSSAALLDGRIPMRKAVTIEQGTLIIDIYDSTAKKLVWSGRASKTLDMNSSREQRKKNINKAVKKLFENYPPR